MAVSTTSSSMDSAGGSRFRHIVFKTRSAGRAIDFSPFADAASVKLISQASPLSADEEDFIYWLLKQAGLDARSYRPETLRRRLPACLRAVRAASLPEARQMIESSPLLVAPAVGAIVIGVTYFFRDAGVFLSLSQKVLPEIAASRREIRIWSAGCSDGAELYSVAMLLADLNLLDRAYLLGTDCRTQAVERARAGVYDPAICREVPIDQIEKHFDPLGRRIRVSDRLMQSVRWRTGDATQVPEPGPWDMILCRNMAMYLQPLVAARLYETMSASLRRGGFLVLGNAERPFGTKHLVPFAPCIYRKD